MKAGYGINTQSCNYNIFHTLFVKVYLVMKRFHYYCEGEFRYAVNGELETISNGEWPAIRFIRDLGTRIAMSYGYRLEYRSQR